MNSAQPSLQLSVVILADRTEAGVKALLAGLREEMGEFANQSEVVLVGWGAEPVELPPGQEQGVRQVPAGGESYAGRLKRGFEAAAGDYIAVLDGSDVYTPGTLHALWEARARADIIIASRYCPGAEARLPLLRRVFSRLLNIVFSRGLDLRVRDMSCAIRLYRAHLLHGLPLESRGYAILQEILVRAMMEGYQIAEIPFTYISRNNGEAYRRVFQFGLDYLRTFTRLWRSRNSIISADYDARAYHALMPPQRYWQRQRYRHITRMIRGQGKCLDVGCGSSRILSALPQGSAALDILLRKLRYARKYALPLVQGSLFALPVPAESFPCVICSQVVEHVPKAGAFDELDRVLTPGGLLVLGTPDYGRWQWRVIEWLYKRILPQAYADEHVTQYTRGDLCREFVERRGYALEAACYILQGELILGLRKPLS